MSNAHKKSKDSGLSRNLGSEYLYVFYILAPSQRGFKTSYTSTWIDYFTLMARMANP